MFQRLGGKCRSLSIHWSSRASLIHKNNKPEEIGMRHFLILSLLACSLPVNAVSTTVEFHYNPDEGKVPKCNGQTKEQKSPFECTFNNQGVLVVSLDSWGWEGTAILALKGEATVPTITGFCTKSVIGNFPSYNLAPACDGEDAAPPPATGDVLVDEWYTDLPWHQKLSTLDSNLIDVPFVLP
jgi:hypothetical protein